jgi:predicted amino acid racemase
LGASTLVDQKTLLENVKIVAEVAKKDGVDPTTAIAYVAKVDAATPQAKQLLKQAGEA